MTKDLAQYGPWALVAGAEGLGEELAGHYAAQGVNILLIARTPDRLAAVAARLRETHGVDVRTRALDLTAETMLDEIIDATRDIEIGTLIFNAGVDAKAGDFTDRSAGNVRRVIALNVIGQTMLAHHFGRQMKERGRGSIIMVGAMLSLSGGGGMSVYAASKAYIFTLAQGLWHELKPHGVAVLGLIIGATLTPAYRRFGMPAALGGIVASDPAVVAQEAIAVLGEEPIWFPSDQQTLAATLRALSPKDAVIKTSRDAAAMHAGRTR